MDDHKPRRSDEDRSRISSEGRRQVRPAPSGARRPWSPATSSRPSPPRFGGGDGAKETFASRSPEDTQAIGARLGARLTAGDVVACIGELGAGKTCFLQGLARGLGVQADVTSPTFVLINHYRGRLPVYHVDAYRTESLTELVDLGVEELFHGDGVTVVEWADKLLPLLPPHAITVTITGLGDEPRQIPLARQIPLEGPVSLVGCAESVPGG
ncbi:MAG: tRNA (adenosine(37)-N6)-threonylcarbamoyltransferase complex ATPase subunit type 1 TsaE [Candidatus Rokubacteria bacterium]|nr:tRNA (adenosine(37)-N6)-threonylcarbamoyltransferase complex ATPase subunit type 1 TsaE [Candidatus Rokubacteria bacterium]